MIRTILRTLVEYLDPPRVIHDRSGVSPYLSRWYLFRSLREVAAGVQRAQQLAANAHRAARREA